MFLNKRLEQLAGRMLLLLLLVLQQVAFAGSEEARLTQSAEGYTREGAEETVAPVERQTGLIVSGSRVTPQNGGQQASGRPVGAHAVQIFSIFDAKSELSRDEDGDGYSHHLRITFDADVDFGEAYVYACLYLSYEGGPWNHYFTTDVFHLTEDATTDDYEVATRLLDGYPTGYYDVLIELYDADYDSFEADYGPDQDIALRALPLEDRLRDGYEDDHYHYHGGGGGLGLSGLFLLGLLGVQRRLWRR
jgi:hypothetical protein